LLIKSNQQPEMYFIKNYKTSLSFLAILLILVSSSFLSKKTSSDTYADFGGWVKLGTQAVSPGVDHDVLNFTEAAETYNRLKFKVSKAPVYIRNIHIIYGDGTSESHSITRHFKKGEASRILPLVGYGRIIKKVIFNYRRPYSNKKLAELAVLAKI